MPEEKPTPKRKKKVGAPAGSRARPEAMARKQEAADLLHDETERILLQVLNERSQGKGTNYEYDPDNYTPWKIAEKFFGQGRHRFILTDVRKLINSILDYFDYLDAAPLQSAQLVTFQGGGRIVNVPKMRAGTINGLCLHIGIRSQTWTEVKAGRIYQNLLPVFNFAEQMLYERKFNGASADMLNPMIIARDLGLTDKSQLTGPNEGPIQTINANMTPQEAMAAYAATLNNKEG